MLSENDESVALSVAYDMTVSEAAPVGHRADLYHFTSIHSLKAILKSDALMRGRNRGPFISLTRNAHWWGWNADYTVRLTLDGARLYSLIASQGLTIGPVEEPRLGHRTATKRGNIDEREERIMGERLDHVRSVIKVIDADRHRAEYAWLDGEHDLSSVALLAPLQRVYHLPITYVGEPLARFAQLHLRSYLDPKFQDRHFLGGPFAGGLSMQAVAQQLFDTLRI